MSSKKTRIEIHQKTFYRASSTDTRTFSDALARKEKSTNTVFYSSTESYENERSSSEGRKSNEGERGGNDIFASSRTNLFWRGVVELFFG